AYLQRPGSAPRPRAEYVIRRRQPAKRSRSLIWVAALVALAFSCCALPVGLAVSWFLGFDSSEQSAKPSLEPVGIAHPMRAVVVLSLEDPRFPSPFVIIGRNGEANRQFASLADAVAQAGDGDVIEVLASGVFRTSPIVIKNKALTIRAAPGFTPGFTFTSD